MSIRGALGRWLLGPELRAELAAALAEHERNIHLTEREQERYWMGRVTAVRRLLEGH